MVSKIIIFNTKLSEIPHVRNEYFTGPPRIVILHMDLAGHTFDDIMRSTDNLGPRYAIGFGASSTVYKCTLKSGKPAAVKKLYTHYQQNTPEFEAELDTVGRIKHRNLVSLLGYSLSPHGNLLFYDYMANGSLWDVLHGKFAKSIMSGNAGVNKGRHIIGNL